MLHIMEGISSSREALAGASRGEAARRSPIFPYVRHSFSWLLHNGAPALAHHQNRQERQMTWFTRVDCISAEKWRKAFLEWLAHDNLSLEQASSERLHKVIVLGGPEVENLLPRRNTARNWILGAYHERQKDVI
jgi:hypothetical protein